MYNHVRVTQLYCCVCATGEFKKKDKLAKPKPSHKGTVIYRLKPFRNQVRPAGGSSRCSVRVAQHTMAEQSTTHMHGWWTYIS